MAPQTNKLFGTKILRQYDEYDEISFDIPYYAFAQRKIPVQLKLPCLDPLGGLVEQA